MHSGTQPYALIREMCMANQPVNLSPHNLVTYAAACVTPLENYT